MSRESSYTPAALWTLDTVRLECGKVCKPSNSHGPDDLFEAKLEVTASIKAVLEGYEIILIVLIVRKLQH